MGKRDQTAKRRPVKPLPNRQTDLAAKWVVDAWQLWCGGLYNWRAIAREVGHHHETVARHVKRYSETLAALLDGGEVNPLGQYLQGLQQDLQHQTTLAGTAMKAVGLDDDDEPIMVIDQAVRSRARREVTEIRKLMASAMGVVTERKGVKVSGDPDAPLCTVFEVVIGGSASSADEDGEDTVQGPPVPA